MTSIPIRIGVIGGGMISQIAHLPFYLADPRCEVVAVAETRPSLLPMLEERVGAAGVLDDHREVLDDASITAVVISAPRPATAPLTLMALNAGKHVLTEKPMALVAEDANRLADVGAERGVIYGVGFMKRYDPGVELAKQVLIELTESGRLGRLLLARVYDYSRSYATRPPPHVRPAESRIERFPESKRRPDWLPARHHAGYDWFVNAAIHDVNLVNYFFDATVEAEAASALHEGALTARLRADDVPVAFEVVQAATGRWIEGAEFVFEDGRLLLDIPSPMAVDAVASVRIEDGARETVEALRPAETGWCFKRQASGFVDSLLGGQPPLTTGADGVKDLMLGEAIWRCAIERSNG